METICSIVGLLSLYHEHILNDDGDSSGDKKANVGFNDSNVDSEKQSNNNFNFQKSKGKNIPWPLLIAIVQQVEVLGEVIAAAKDRNESSPSLSAPFQNESSSESNIRQASNAAASVARGLSEIATNDSSVHDLSMDGGSSYKYLVITLIEMLKSTFRYCQLARGEGNILIDGALFDTDRKDYSNNRDNANLRSGRSMSALERSQTNNSAIGSTFGVSGGVYVDEEIELHHHNSEPRRKAAQRAMNVLRGRLKAESKSKHGRHDSKGNNSDNFAIINNNVGRGVSGDDEDEFDSDVYSTEEDDEEDFESTVSTLSVKDPSSSSFIDPSWWFHKQAVPQHENSTRDSEMSVRRCPSLLPSIRPGRMPPQVSYDVSYLL